MHSAGVVEAVDVFEDRWLGRPAGGPGPLPQSFSLDRFEDVSDRRVVVAIACAAHRYLEPVLAQRLVVIVSAV